jgi:23S rRNA pseudouridine1911/1915/1917 synthase
MNKDPFIIEETDDFAVVFKPPRMHSAQLKKDALIKNERAENTGTIFEWYVTQTFGTASPAFCEIMHRLDYETHGLVLFAKNQKSFEFFKCLQEKGEFIKEYSVICNDYTANVSAGFPPPPENKDRVPSDEKPMIIESYFRPYGEGRKLVRPVTEIKKNREIATDRGNFYRTEIISKNDNIFTARIKRGFRHQIRCHLCWIGFPVLNDPLYSHSFTNGQFLALRASALFFTDPSDGSRREYRIDALEKTPF